MTARYNLILITISSAITATLVVRAETKSADSAVIPLTLSETVVNPSPEAASMRRYVDERIDYSTGRVEIDVPLLSWTSGALNVALGLSYHTGGVRINDEAGWIGLGWSLTGLGSISRAVVGLPDDSPDTFFDLRERTSSRNVDYLVDLMKHTRDADLDRYIYSFPGYSGSFVVNSNETVVQLPTTDLIIERVAETLNTKATDKFIITTPDGQSYEFAVKESIAHSYRQDPVPIIFYSSDFDAVTTWYLSKIVAPERQDSATIEYSTMEPWTTTSGMNTRSVSYRRGGSYAAGELVANTGITIGAFSHTNFKGQKIPLRITTKHATAEFKIAQRGTMNPWTGHKPTAAITSISLKRDDGTLVKEVDFSNNLTFSDGRFKLTGVEIRDSKSLLDSRTFDYVEASQEQGYDLFGYANGKPSVNNTFLNTQGIVTNNRSSSSRHASSCALTTIHDAMGLTTTLEYEPSRWTATTDNYRGGLLGDTIDIGLRVKCITATDAATGRIRRRTFQYDGATLSADLWKLGIEAYMGLSGSIYFQRSGLNYSAINSTAAIPTESSRLAGHPVEKTVVYYKTVTEEISGTNMENSKIRIVRSFDPAASVHHDDNCGSTVLPNPTADYVGVDAKYLGVAQLFDSSKPWLQKVFSAKLIRNYFHERVGISPVMIGKRIYKETIGGFELVEEESHRWKMVDSTTIAVGLHRESAVATLTDELGVNHLNITDVNDVNHGIVRITTGRMICDSSAVVRHYPGGKNRTVTTTRDYRGVPGPLRFHTILSNNIIDLTCYHHPGRFGDSAAVTIGKYHTKPLATKVSCGSSSISSYDLRAENVERRFFSDATQRGLRHLPVATKWVIDGTRDSITRANLYGIFNCGGRCLTRPVAQAIIHGADTVDCLRFGGYDRFGQPSSSTTKGITTQYSRDNWGNLTSKRVGALTWTYTHSPMIGCESVTSPSGMKRLYDYSGTRLASESDQSGNVLKEYAYALRGVSPDYNAVNSIAVTTRLDESRTSTSTTYHDGLGQPTSTIADESGLVSTATIYDALGRPVRTYAPFTGDGARPITPSELHRAAVADLGDARPYVENSYDGVDPAPKAIYPAGEAFAAHPASRLTTCNRSSDPFLCVVKLEIGVDGASVVNRGSYADGELEAVVSTDPDGHRVVTMTDWRGLTVLSRTELSAGRHLDTRSFHTPLGLPVLTLPPSAVEKIPSTKGATLRLADLEGCYYRWVYDGALRPVSVKMPGAEPVKTVYDTNGVAVFVNDGELRAAGKTRFAARDMSGRPTISGICDIADIPSEAVKPILAYPVPTIPALPETAGNGTGMTTSNFPPSAEILTVDYYDDYRFTSLKAFAGLKGRPEASAPSGASSGRGLLTGRLVAVMSGVEGDTASRPMIATVVRYDDRERPIRTVSTTAKAGRLTVDDFAYDLAGNPTAATSKIIDGDSTLTVSTNRSYDRLGRLLSVKTSFQGVTGITSSSLTYDRSGRVASHTVDGLTTTYAYEASGATRSIKSPLFEQTLLRADASSPLYSGRIGAKRETLAGVDFGYDYVYDGAGRLVSAGTPAGHADCSAAFGYDSDSGLTSITRHGPLDGSSTGTVDDLTIKRRGGRPVDVDDLADVVLLENSLDFTSVGEPDGGDAYRYDLNGNLVADVRRGIDLITYGVDNRPLAVKAGTSSLGYLRSADGRKLAETYRTSVRNSLATSASTILRPLVPVVVTTREYVGPAEYVDGRLDRVNVDGGYFTADGAFHAILSDYRGDVRAVVRRPRQGDDQSKVRNGRYVEQTDFYYPYGLPTALSTDGEVSRRKVEGKEFETRMGLDMADFGPRGLLPDIGSFASPDPLASATPAVTPYAYCAADPVNLADPSGMTVIFDPDATPKQRSDYESFLTTALKSKMFYYVYDKLDQSNEIINI